MSIETPHFPATDDHTAVVPEHVEDVERVDLGHFAAVILRWWVVVLAGTIFTVGTAVALLRLTTPPYRAETVLVFDQPVASAAAGQQGLAATQAIIDLLPTYASIATSDAVLTEAGAAAGVRASIEQLRDRVTAQPVANTLALRIAVEDERAPVAEKLALTVTESFGKLLDQRQASAGIPSDKRSTVQTLSVKRASREQRSEVRTVVLAALLGLTIMIAVAFLLEYIRPRGESPT